MSVKITHNLHKFEKTNKKYRSTIKYVVVIAAFVIFASIVLHYKSRILGIILNSRDYGMKIKNVHISDTLNAIDASMILFNKDIDVSIKAGSVVPSEESGASNLKDISATLVLKKDGRKFFVTSLHGSLKQGKGLNLYPNPVIFDTEGNKANFSQIVVDMALGTMSGKEPIINGTKDDYLYNIKGSLAVYGEHKGQIDIAGPVHLYAKNSSNNEDTKGFGESAVIDIEKKLFTLKKHVKIEHLTYFITCDLVDIFFNDNSHKQKQTKQEHKMFSSDVEKIDMRGHVYLFDSVQKVKIWSDISEYNSETGDVIFSKNVKVDQVGKTIFASRAVYNLNTQKFQIVSSSNAVSKRGLDGEMDNSKVTIIFN